MSLYGNFTLKEWLSINCSTRDVNELFRKALKDNDEPMAVLALTELIERCDKTDIVYAIQEAVDTGWFAPGSHFSDVLANTLLTQCDDRDPLLRRVGKNIRKRALGLEAASVLLDDIPVE